MPLLEFLKYLAIEVVLFIIWIVILDFQIIPDRPPKKKTEIKLRGDNYPFDDGNIVRWDEYY